MKVRIPNQGPSRNDMLKQVQKMQEDMANLQADLDAREYTVTSGGGMISVTINGKHEITELKINPDAIDPEEPKCLRTLLPLRLMRQSQMQLKPLRRKWAHLPAVLIFPVCPECFNYGLPCSAFRKAAGAF